LRASRAAIFSGSLCAGAVGTLWSSLSHAAFFAFLATLAAILLLALDRFPGQPGKHNHQRLPGGAPGEVSSASFPASDAT
jgi:hypothetical protein